MAPRKKRVSLTDGELELMSFLWQRGEMSLSEAHENFTKPIGYTTMQTRLNRLVEKGLVVRSETRPAKYSAAIKPEAVSSSKLNDLVDKTTEGSVVPLVAQLIEERALSAHEIADIKNLIEQAERRLSKGRGKK